MEIKHWNAAYDIDSKLGTYLQINPSLSAPSYMFKSCFETDRLLLTRFRCGLHSSLIEKGRFMNVPRCDRLCPCGNGIQNSLHCFSVCSLTLPILEKRYTNLKDIFEDEDICDLLHRVCKKLKLPIWLYVCLFGCVFRWTILLTLYNDVGNYD